MCEIFCFNSNKATEVNECLKCFYEHCDEHPHGWGLANMHSNGAKISKEPIKAKCSENLKNILSNPIVGKNIFAHIRLATMGELITPNCHPFTQADDNNRSWILIHNGTIFDYPPLDEYKSKENGDTDSERILLYIIDKVNEAELKKGENLNAYERFNLLTNIISDMSLNNKLNLMICDGNQVYIHSNLDGSLYYLRTDDGLLFTTTPIDGKLSLRPHPSVFGNKSSNPFITTDFSESQIEIITPTFDSIDEAYEVFTLLSDLVNTSLPEDECLWFQSLPCILPYSDKIPIAKYDETGKDNENYRKELARKYGVQKQLISGVHFNFSFKEDIIKKLYAKTKTNYTYKEFKNEVYLKIARNYLRYVWLIIYLTGCSVGAHKTFSLNVYI